MNSESDVGFFTAVGLVLFALLDIAATMALLKLAMTVLRCTLYFVLQSIYRAWQRCRKAYRALRAQNLPVLPGLTHPRDRWKWTVICLLFAETATVFAVLAATRYQNPAAVEQLVAERPVVPSLVQQFGTRGNIIGSTSTQVDALLGPRWGTSTELWRNELFASCIYRLPNGSLVEVLYGETSYEPSHESRVVLARWVW